MSRFPQRETLVEVLRDRAEIKGSQLLYRFLATGEVDGPTQELTYAELDVRARAIGAFLLAQGMEGERLILLHPAGLEFIAAFMGCQYAGAVAVPVYPPDLMRLDLALERLRRIAADAGARGVLTTRSMLLETSEALSTAEGLGDLAWWSTDDVDSGLAGQWEMPELSGGSLSFLQYTSGSTGQPKGVVIRHANLIYNERMVQAGFRADEDSDFVSWLPLSHDMGLIAMVLNPLYSGSSCTLMAPQAFARKPTRWLRAIAHFGAAITAAPNFAYELCARRVRPRDCEDLDLRGWRVAANGAEPVRAHTIDRFCEALAPSGFRRESFFPAYGLAEATVFVSGGPVDAPPATAKWRISDLELGRVEPATEEDGERETRSLVSCGRSWLDQEILIVDPETRTRCAPDRVGEIWVRGANVAGGYWRRPEESAAVFGARLADTGEGPFLRTGDLGFLWGDELVITGRLKDLIILRGRNLDPQEIEATAEGSHRAVCRAGCAAFSIDVDDEEQLAIACEVLPSRGEPAEVAAAIRRAVFERYEVRPHTVALVERRALPKTTSGKVQRRASRALFLSGELALIEKVVDAPPPHQAEPESSSAASAIGLADHAPLHEALLAAAAPERSAILGRRLRTLVAQTLRTDPTTIDLDMPLVNLAIDSLAGAEVRARIEDELKLELPATVLLRQPTMAAVVDFVLASWLCRFMMQPEPESTASVAGSAAPGDAMEDFVL